MDTKHYCVICKHYGIYHPEGTYLERTQIYDEEGIAVPILLCKKHSVELFKRGQKMFLVSHYKILVDLMDSDDIKFLEVLEKTVKRNQDKIV